MLAILTPNQLTPRVLEFEPHWVVAESVRGQKHPFSVPVTLLEARALALALLDGMLLLDWDMHADVGNSQAREQVRHYVEEAWFLSDEEQRGIAQRVRSLDLRRPQPAKLPTTREIHAILQRDLPRAVSGARSLMDQLELFADEESSLLEERLTKVVHMLERFGQRGTGKNAEQERILRIATAIMKGRTCTDPTYPSDFAARISLGKQQSARGEVLTLEQVSLLP